MKPETDEVESERRWDDLFAKSRDMLLEMAAEAIREDEAGLTEPLNREGLEMRAVRITDMQIVSGKVVDGQIVVEGDLPEGSDVTLLALDGEEEFEVGPELEAVLLDSIAQGQRGETISAEDLLREMRDRE